MLLERIIRTMGANADDKLDVDPEGEMHHLESGHHLTQVLLVQVEQLES